MANGPTTFMDVHNTEQMVYHARMAEIRPADLVHHDEKLGLEKETKMSVAEIQELLGRVVPEGATSEWFHRNGAPRTAVYYWDKRAVVSIEILYRRLQSDGERYVRRLEILGADSGSGIAAQIVDALLKAGFERQWFRGDRSKVNVTFAFSDRDGEVNYEYTTFERQPLEGIAENYSQSVVDAARKLKEQLKDVTSGIVILSGPPGTGKTHLIRALLTEIADERLGCICLPPLSFLADFAALTRVASQVDRSLIVFEDIGDVLNTTAHEVNPDITSNLLNVTDGLISLLNDAVLLVSFNTDLHEVNPALLRPGRCLATIEVSTLSTGHAARLVGTELEERGSGYTLAEVYAMREERSVTQVKRQQRKTGFRT